MSETTAAWSRGTLRVKTTARFGSREYRCRIEHRVWSDSVPGVRFSYRTPDAGVNVLSDWSTAHYNRLGGPNGLWSWRCFFEVFAVAFDAYRHAVASTDYYNRNWPDNACPECESLSHPEAAVGLADDPGVTERCSRCGFEPEPGFTVPSNEATGGRVEVIERGETA